MEDAEMFLLEQRNSQMYLGPKTGHRIAGNQGDLGQPEHARQIS
jgi:hypothetical protein